MRRTKENGNVLFLILIAVVLLAALSYVIARPGGESATSSVSLRLSEDMRSQAQTIRSALLECVLVHNYGYPAEPVSGLLADTECQIDDVPNYEGVFSGTAARFLPPPPKPFTGAWTYDVNGATTPPTVSVTLTQAINCSGDAGLSSAMSTLASHFSAAEIATTCNGTTMAFTLYVVKGTP